MYLKQHYKILKLVLKDYIFNMSVFFLTALTDFSLFYYFIIKLKISGKKSASAVRQNALVFHCFHIFV